MRSVSEASSVTIPPLVSIAIPTYNHADVVGAALRSALSQTYQHVEILLFDNASSDSTRQVIADVAKDDPRVRYVRNDVNLGMTGNFNACISAATGDFIKFLCADDLLSPDCVATMVEAFTRNPGVVLVASARQLVNEKLIPLAIAGVSKNEKLVDGATAFRDCFFRGNLIGEPTAVMFRREQAVRGFRENYRQLIDLEMWMYLLRSGGMYFISRPLCTVRQHPEQATQKHLKSGVVLADKCQLFREFHRELRNTSVLEKLRWDIRMAATRYKTLRAGGSVIGAGIEETYFPAVFPWFTEPVARLLLKWAGN